MNASLRRPPQHNPAEGHSFGMHMTLLPQLIFFFFSSPLGCFENSIQTCTYTDSGSGVTPQVLDT